MPTINLCGAQKNYGVNAANAYRELRRVQHKARLNEQSTALDAEAAAPLQPHRDAVLALWQAVFG